MIRMSKLLCRILAEAEVKWSRDQEGKQVKVARNLLSCVFCDASALELSCPLMYVARTSRAYISR